MRQDDNTKNKVENILDEICRDPHVKQMDRYIQHGKVTTYDHCIRVARKCASLNKNFSLRAKEDVLIRGAMLHDFYLYNWHDKDEGAHDWHGFIHADRAVENAKRHFNIGREEEHIISCHMWPLNITRIPKTREAWIVCIADKIVSVEEVIMMRKGFPRK